MRLLAHNWKTGFAKVLVETLDDLWYLSTLIEEGDTVAGHTTRKVMVGGEDSGKVVRKHCFITLRVEKIEFAEFATQLRLLGKVSEGAEDIPKGSYHTLAVEERDTITITKPWAKFQIMRITEACNQAVPEVLICLLDRDQATFALLKRSGYNVLTTLSGEVERKYDSKITAKEFYPEVLKALQEYDRRMKLAHIIIASPAFWKENFAREVRDPALKRKLIFATVSATDESALREVLQRPEVQHALARDRISKEQAVVEELMAAIAKDDLATYGMVMVAQAAEAGAIATLLVSDALLRRTRQDGTYAKLEQLMKRVEHGGGKVMLIAADHDGGKRLEGLGGVAALLRYRIAIEQ